MNDLTPEIKKAVGKHLAKMNELLAKAIADAKAGKNKDAIDEVADAIDEKQKVIGALPGVTDEDSINVPFAAIYDVFSDFDSLADAVGALLTGLHSTDPPGKEDRKELIEKLRRAIKDMRRLIMRHAWSERAESALEEMIAELKSLIEILKKPEGTPEEWKKFEGIQKLLRAFKQAFFEIFPATVPLWDIYDLLWHIDRDLAQAKHRLAEGDPPASRKGRMTQALIEGAKAMKDKLELALAQLEYPPGSDDLPPFPPNHAAIKKVDKILSKGRAAA